MTPELQRLTLECITDLLEGHAEIDQHEVERLFRQHRLTVLKIDDPARGAAEEAALDAAFARGVQYLADALEDSDVGVMARVGAGQPERMIRVADVDAVVESMHE